MKKCAVVLPILLLMGLLLFFFAGTADMGGGNAAYLRIHIRADSNEEAAQAVKYQVRDEVVALLTPIVSECRKKAEAMEAVQKNLPAVERAAEKVLRENGFSYGARASLRREEFPTRVYDGVTLTAGVYDALILELGSGKGDNWWCVVYPPLCFTSGENVIYRSKIAEIIREFFGE